MKENEKEQLTIDFVNFLKEKINDENIFWYIAACALFRKIKKSDLIDILNQIRGKIEIKK